MTKQIEEELNLPDLNEALAKIQESESDEDTEEESVGIVEKIDGVRDLREALKNIKVDDMLDNSKIDEVQQKALEAYKDMLDAGFNCDSKHASNFLEPAVQALSIALDGENVKLRKKVEFQKLKQQEERLELMRRKMELEERKAGLNLEVVDDDSIMADRNDILRQLFKDDNNDK